MLYPSARTTTELVWATAFTKIMTETTTIEIRDDQLEQLKATSLAHGEMHRVSDGLGEELATF